VGWFFSSTNREVQSGLGGSSMQSLGTGKDPTPQGRPVKCRAAQARCEV